MRVSPIKTIHEKQIQNHQIKLKFECTKCDAQFINLTEVLENSKSHLIYGTRSPNIKYLAVSEAKVVRKELRMVCRPLHF